MRLDSVYKQAVQVPMWVRGEPEIASVQSSTFGFQNVSVTALGMSVGTGENGLSAKVVEVHGLKDLENFEQKAIEGKIVFF